LQLQNQNPDPVDVKMVKLKLKLPTKTTYFGAESLSRLKLFRAMIQKVNWIGKIIGCDIYSQDYSCCNFLFFMMMITLTLSSAINVYSLYLYRKNIERFCFCFITFASMIQGLYKLYIFIYHQPKNQELIARIEHFITNLDTKESNAIFDKWMLYSCHISVALLLTVLITVCFIAVYPAILYLFVGEKILHFGYVIPFVDWTTPFGYCLNFIFDIIGLYFFCCSTTSSVIDTINYIVMSLGQFELLEHLIKELDKLILIDGRNLNDEKIKNSISLIVELHNELLE
jgi:7tm Odorant receptor